MLYLFRSQRNTMFRNYICPLTLLISKMATTSTKSHGDGLPKWLPSHFIQGCKQCDTLGRLTAVPMKSNTLLSLLLIAGMSLLTINVAQAYPVRISGSYLGGSGKDELTAVAFLPDGKIVVAGNTNSTDLGTAAGVTPTVFGTDATSASFTGFIAILSEDGTQLLQISRFPWATCYIQNMEASVDGIYVIGYATGRLQNVPLTTAYKNKLAGADGDYAGTTSFRPFLARISLDGTQVLAHSTLMGDNYGADTGSNGAAFWASKRDVNDIEIFSNGDLLINHDRNSRFFDYASRVYADLSGRDWVNSQVRVDDAFYSGTCDDTRAQGIALSPDEEHYYVIGYAQTNTSKEPYKMPFIFKFRSVPLGNEDRAANTEYWYQASARPFWYLNPPGVRLWERTEAQRGGTVEPLHGQYGVYNFDPYPIRNAQSGEPDPGLELISDTTGRGIDVASDGSPIVAISSDGGASVVNYSPLFIPFVNADKENYRLPSSILGGDLWTGLSGATTLSAIGKLDADAINTQWGWHQVHRVQGLGGNPFNKLYRVVAGLGDKAYAIGSGRDVQKVEQWTTNTGSGILMKLNIDSSGSTREFVTHFAGTHEMLNIAYKEGDIRYAAVGWGWVTGADTTNGFQTESAGDDEGYVVVWDDNNLDPTETYFLDTEADASIRGTTGGRDENWGDHDQVVANFRDFGYNARDDQNCKAYIRFDLSSLSKPITQARFQGFCENQYGEGNFEVYILDDAVDNWDEMTITWNNAPSNNINSGTEIDTTNATSVGTFTIEKINATRTVSFDDPALATALETARSTGDGKATLVIVRKENDPVGGGFQMTSRESAALGNNHAPRLRVVLEGGGTVSDPYNTWIASYSLSGDDALMTADPDGDGQSNLVEFAANTAPNDQAGVMIKSITVDDSTGSEMILITYRRNSTATDVTFAVETNTDLTNTSGWTEQSVTHESAGTDTDGTPLYSVRLPKPASDSHGFYRIKLAR